MRCRHSVMEGRRQLSRRVCPGGDGGEDFVAERVVHRARRPLCAEGVAWAPSQGHPHHMGARGQGIPPTDDGAPIQTGRGFKGGPPAVSAMERPALCTLGLPPADRGALWSSVTLCGALWYSGCSGALWRSVALCGTLWLSVVLGLPSIPSVLLTHSCGWHPRALSALFLKSH